MRIQTNTRLGTSFTSTVEQSLINSTFPLALYHWIRNTKKPRTGFSTPWLNSVNIWSDSPHFETELFLSQLRVWNIIKWGRSLNQKRLKYSDLRHNLIFNRRRIHSKIKDKLHSAYHQSGFTLLLSWFLTRFTLNLNKWVRFSENWLNFSQHWTTEFFEWWNRYSVFTEFRFTCSVGSFNHPIFVNSTFE